MSSPDAGKSAHGLATVVEAMLFAADEPISLKQFVEILALLDSETRGKKVGVQAIEAVLEKLNREYEQNGRAFRIVQVAGGYQFATRPEYGVWLGAMMKERSRRKLSVSALESLAVVAYKQPVTKPELEAIRGVNADYVIRSLLERNLIAIVGRAATPGRPLLYGTTKEFLKHFGLNDLSDLPKPREIDELLEEAEFEVEKKLIREQDAADRDERAAGGEGELPPETEAGPA
jgi:segregation and condensation protein B